MKLFSLKSTFYNPVKRSILFRVKILGYVAGGFILGLLVSPILFGAMTQDRIQEFLNFVHILTSL